LKFLPPIPDDLFEAMAPLGDLTMTTIQIPTSNMFEFCDEMYGDNNWLDEVHWTPKTAKHADVHCANDIDATIIKLKYG
jgi:hypothetical protein